MKLCLIILLISFKVIALEGTIRVLEAPLFATQDDTGKVVQYLRKGEEIFIHGQEGFKDKFFDKNNPNNSKIELLEDNDPLVGSKSLYIPESDSKFYKTITKIGNEAYILKKHVFINFKDKRELSQKKIKHDETDYRIPEPLPKGYPFEIETGYRGQILITTGQPNYNSYQFTDKIIDTNFDLIKELNFVWSRNESFDKENRFFFGAMGGFHVSSINYILETQTASQTNTRLYVGPYASYDTYRTKKYIFNMYTSLQFSIYDEMQIRIKNSVTKEEDTRSYSGDFTIFPNIGASFQSKKSFFEFDTVIGFNMRFLLPKTYNVQEKATEDGLWQNSDNSDSFKQTFRTELTYFFGIQSYY